MEMRYCLALVLVLSSLTAVAAATEAPGSQPQSSKTSAERDVKSQPTDEKPVERPKSEKSAAGGETAAETTATKPAAEKPAARKTIEKSVKQEPTTEKRAAKFGKDTTEKISKTVPAAVKPEAEKPAAKPIVEKPAAKPIAEKPAAKPIVEKPAAKPIVEKPAVEKPAAKPIVEKPAAKPIAEKPARKPEAEKPSAKPAAGKTKLPNIVFLYADDLGIGDVGCFGNSTLRTPHMDSLCARGAKLSQHIAAGATCTPSRAAMLTGRYPIRSGMASPHDYVILISSAAPAGLPPTEVTIADVLKGKGYKTGLIGKWHLGLDSVRGDRAHNPTNFGFDYFFGTPLSNFRNLGENGGDQVLVLFPNMYRNVAGIILATLIATYFLKKVIGTKIALFFLFISLAVLAYAIIMLTKPHIFASILLRNDEVVEQPIRFERMTERLVKEGVRFLEDRHEDQQPFFLFMSWLQVHTNLHAGPPFKGRSAHGAYGDEVEELDWSIGQILKALDHFGFTDDTLIYFSSDNGGHLEEEDGNGALAGGYNSIYRGGKGQGGQEGGIRVPTAISWPGHIRPGLVIDEPTSQMDLLPTLAHIAGTQAPTDRIIDGKDMTPLLLEREHTSPHEVMFHYCGNDIHSARYRPKTGISTYKLHWKWPKYDPGVQMCKPFVCACFTLHEQLSTPRLYDITNDPSEVNELDIRQPEYAEIVDIMTKAKEEQEKSTKEIPTEMNMLNMISRPWLNTCCNFPYCNCEDADNALKYTLPFKEK